VICPSILQIQQLLDKIRTYWFISRVCINKIQTKPVESFYMFYTRSTININASMVNKWKTNLLSYQDGFDITDGIVDDNIEDGVVDNHEPDWYTEDWDDQHQKPNTENGQGKS